MPPWTVSATFEPKAKAPPNSNNAATSSAVGRVNALAPTDEANELATSLAPTPKAATKETWWWVGRGWWVESLCHECRSVPFLALPTQTTHHARHPEYPCVWAVCVGGRTGASVCGGGRIALLAPPLAGGHNAAPPAGEATYAVMGDSECMARQSEGERGGTRFWVFHSDPAKEVVASFFATLLPFKTRRHTRPRARLHPPPRRARLCPARPQ